MKSALRVLAAEALKQHRRMSGSKLVFFSMLLWPPLQLAVVYYTVRPVVVGTGAQRWPGVADGSDLLAFLSIGALGFAFFFSLVQSSWHFSFERQTGTLELIFLSPANRLVLVIANGVGALVQNVWLFLCFSGALLVASDGVHLASPAMLVVVFLALLVPAIAWGAFLNSLLIFSRDSAFLYTLFDEPMNFVSGAQVPTFVLPGFVAGIGNLLPLTTCLVVTRRALTDGANFGELLPQLLSLVLISAVFLALAAAVLIVGERRVQRTGQLKFF